MANSPKQTQEVLLLVQLGSPASTKTSDVRSYLREFLLDRRVVDLPRFFWSIILYLVVLPFRPQKSAKAYRRIWTNEGAPLVVTTEKLRLKLKETESLKDVDVRAAFLLNGPRVVEVLTKISRDYLGRDYHLQILPLFPLYSESTNASVFDNVSKGLKPLSYIPRHTFLGPFHLSPTFIQESVANIKSGLKSSSSECLIISFHGIPKRCVTEKGDPYERHTQECFEALCLELRKQGIVIPVVLSYQSRFGSEEWLGPATDLEALRLLKEKSVKKLAVYCPSFLIDCLETIDEIGHELKIEVEEAGGELVLIPCLNVQPTWVQGFAREIKTGLLDKVEIAPNKERAVEKISEPENKNVLKAVFLTLFLDLMGFSIIFPLFPALAKYYIEVDGNNFLLKGIFAVISSTVGHTPDLSQPLTSQSVVLFGGVLGALYSFLQFVAAPIWGKMSDQRGRRPILLWSVFCMCISYLIWFFSGSFTLLVISRIIGGLMSGNISAATAVIADVTTQDKRARGMATVGIAFALGFIIGPAIGGISAMLNWQDLVVFSQDSTFRTNPFSAPAAISFMLSVINLIFLWRFFPETLKKEKSGQSKGHERSSNIFKIFKPLPFKGVNLTNIGHFLFLLAFSGMEFTLTFLAVERLSFTPINNAMMFVFIGFIIVLVQGGVVRRKAAQIGERRLALTGIILALPGLIAIGYAETKLMLYLGLFFLSIGSALFIPCMTALVSRYTPQEHQGHSIGIFRSLGALGRVIGPLAASIIYWNWGASYPYYIGAAFLLLPLILVWKLPPTEAKT